MNEGTIDFEKNGQAAALLISQGKLAEARQLCEQVCEHVSDAYVLYLLGLISNHEGQYAQAAEYCRKALRIMPAYINAKHCLGNALRRINDYGGAYDCFAEIIAKRPDDIKAYNQLGLTLEAASDYKGALRCYRKMQQLKPQSLNAVAGEASVYERQGKPEMAYKTLLPYMDSGRMNSRIAVQYGKLARKLGLHEQAVCKLQSYINDRSLTDEKVRHVHFLLGALYDDIGKYDEAFEHFSIGNSLMKVTPDSAGFTNRVDDLIARFSQAAMAKTTRATTVSDQPVFVIGMPRSGTSLVEQVLSSHPVVKGAGELPYVNAIAGFLEEQSNGIEQLDSDILNQCADKYLAHVSRFDKTARKVVDKMPSNFLNLGYIELLFPGARVIHCRRDPIDTCLSCYFQNFTSVLTEMFDLESIGRYYLDYARMMRHWREVITMPVLEVDYESIVSDPESQIRRLVEFTGLPWDESCLKFYENKTAVRTASYDQVRQPIYQRSVGRWRHYEQHIGVLIDLLRRG